MRDQYTIPEDIDRFDGLTKAQKLQYKLIANREERLMRRDCLSVLVSSLRYREPVLVNSAMAFE